MSKEETILGIPIRLIKARRNLLGVWRAFGVSSREAFDALGISDEKLAEYLAEKRTEKAVSEDEGDGEDGKFDYVQKLYDGGSSPEEIERHERAVEERFALYLKDFEAPIEPDRFFLRTLASMDVWLEKIQRAKIQYVDELTPVARKRRHDLIEEEKKLSAEARLLQKSLGIDRATRDRRRKDEPDADTVTEIVKLSAKWMDTQLIQPHHCGISLGMLYLPFPELWEPLVTSCPRCKEKMRVEIEVPSTEQSPDAQ